MSTPGAAEGGLEPKFEELAIRSVYQLLPAPRDKVLDIVFFHGLQLGDYKDAYKTTWQASDGQPTGMLTFLASDFPNARILTVSYDASATGQVSYENHAKKICRDLVEIARVGDTCPVVFVGHSLGGLVMKQVFIMVNVLRTGSGDRKDGRKHDYQKLFDNMRGMVWYGTPHAGAPLADIARYFGSMASPVARLLTPFNERLAHISMDFDQVLPTHVKRRSFYELQPMRKWWWSRIVVPQATAMGGGGDHYSLDYDHIHICKPTQQVADQRYKYLYDLVLEEAPANGQEQSQEMDLT